VRKWAVIGFFWFYKLESADKETKWTKYMYVTPKVDWGLQYSVQNSAEKKLTKAIKMGAIASF